METDREPGLPPLLVQVCRGEVEWSAGIVAVAVTVAGAVTIGGGRGECTEAEHRRGGRGNPVPDRAIVVALTALRSPHLLAPIAGECPADPPR